jgi:hypothetical protein
VRKLIDTHEEHTELVEYVEEEHLDHQRERDRQQRRESARVAAGEMVAVSTPEDTADA